MLYGQHGRREVAAAASTFKISIRLNLLPLPLIRFVKCIKYTCVVAKFMGNTSFFIYLREVDTIVNFGKTKGSF